MGSLIPVIVGFILTGVVGNRLVHHWQSRSWLAQQRFSGDEKEFIVLKELADEIASLLGERIYHTQRISLSMSQIDGEIFLEKYKEYEEVVKRWNVRLTSFFVRLRLIASSDFSHRLEEKIQKRLVNISDRLAKVAEQKKCSSNEWAEIRKSIEEVQVQAINFNDALLSFVLRRKDELYNGRIIKFSAENLNSFSTWTLIKAIFARDVNSLSVVRSKLDS